MKVEYFDVVNERDEPVGRAPRSEVHAKGLWHRAVHILLFNEAGEVLVQKRSRAKDMSPGLWDSSCSGHVDAGEAYDAAAVRELREELGIALAAPPPRWFRLEASIRTGWEFVWVYRLRDDTPVAFERSEIDAVEWLAPANLTRRMELHPERFAPPFVLIWSIARGRLN